MPASKFVFPPNGATIQSNQNFTVQMAINNLETGNFVNANSNYYSAPQQYVLRSFLYIYIKHANYPSPLRVNAQGDIIGHTHFVIETLDSLDQTTPLDNTKFAFFKGVNGAAVNGIVSEPVPTGLPAGAYRLASINAAANHQPVLVAVAQHGSLDDMVYFTVSDDPNAASASVASATATAAPAASSSANTGAKGGKGGNQNNKGGKFVKRSRFAREH